MSDIYKEVKTEYGLLRGQKKTSSEFPETTYYSFQGIPFAKPPVGNLRFKDPQEPESWSEVHDALREGNKSCQYDKLLEKYIGSEDCLYLNVYTRDPDASGKAVMVWIHGGAFVFGSASSEMYGPEYLIECDIVLVTANYRLGALGFLCLGNNDVPGNAGLKDQVMALKWVQKNISNFGGDPKNVTLFGESAGGVCVQYHLLSPLSRGLFHRAVIQSGSVLNPGSYMDRSISVERAFKLGSVLGCATEKPDKLLEFLQEVPAYKITDAQSKVVSDSEKWLNFQKRFVPCVELPGTGECFLPSPPKELLQKGLFTKVPIIMGVTNKEGGITLEVSVNGELNFQKINKEFELVIPPDIGLTAGSEKSIQLSNKIKSFYFNDKQPSWETFDELVTLFGDINFQNGFDRTLHYYLEFSETPAYTYYLQYEISFSFIKAFLKQRFPNVEFKGVMHGDDIALLFNQSGRVRGKDCTDVSVSNKMTKAWTHFAKTGNPNYQDIETVWMPSKKDELCYLDIGKEFKMVNGRISSNRMKFLEEIYKEIS